jgi:hypothetical protein
MLGNANTDEYSLSLKTVESKLFFNEYTDAPRLIIGYILIKPSYVENKVS